MKIKKPVSNFNKEVKGSSENHITNNPDFNPYKKTKNYFSGIKSLFRKDTNDSFKDISYKLKVSNKKLNMTYRHNRYFVIIKLLFVSWFKSFWGPISAFIIPIFIFLMWAIFSPLESASAVVVLFQAIVIAIVSINITTFPIQYVEYKKSSLLKRIATTPLSRKEFLISIIIFNLCVTISSIIVTHIIIYAAYHKIFDFHHMHILNLIIGYILFIIPILLIGLLIGSLSKTANWAAGLGTLMFFIIIGYGVLTITQETSTSTSGFLNQHSVQIALNIIKFLLPFSFGQKIIFLGYYPDIIQYPIKWYEYLQPIIYSGILSLIVLKLFKRDI